MAFVAAMGFVLSSTAIVMQILEERGETTEPHGQKIVSILLLEDLAIVPLLAIVAFLAPIRDGSQRPVRAWSQIGIAVGAVAGVCRRRPLAAQSAVPHPRRRPRRARS